MNPADARATPGPREVLELLRGRVRDGFDMDGQADLYAPDGVLERPFAPAGVPRRIRGREEIRKVLVAAGRSAREAGHRIVRFDPVVVHETAEPAVIVAEFDMHGEVATTGATYRVSFIRVIRVRDGEIVSMRDYFSGEALEAAFEAAFEAGQTHG